MTSINYLSRSIFPYRRLDARKTGVIILVLKDEKGNLHLNR